jgi:hypothetical protein
MKPNQIKDLMEAYASIYTNLSESHYAVGDKVTCKKSGMSGKVVKVDPEEEGKYYTVEREDGKKVKYSPEEIESKKQEQKEEVSGLIKSLRKEEYDALLNHLLEEGYANTEDAAIVIAENMSDEWIDNILETHPVDRQRLARQQGRPIPSVTYLVKPKPKKKTIG